MRFQGIIDKIYYFLTKREVYHSLFWLTLLSLQLSNSYNRHNLTFTFINELISLAFYMVMVYINLRVLIPKYLARFVFIYFISIVSLALIVTPVKVFVLYLRYGDLPTAQADLVDRQLFLYVGSFMVIIVSTVLKMLTDWWRYQQEKQEIVTQSIQSELRFLRTQINPHFLFNTLNNIYALTLKKNDKAPETVLKLAEIMRYMLYDCNEKQVFLSKEITYLQNYLDLERIRLSQKVKIDFEVEGEVSDQKIVPLLFIVFLENSFKHGANAHLGTPGYIKIQLRVRGKNLTFDVSNSKPEYRPRESHAKEGGIGLVNVRQRLRLHYPNTHSLRIYDNPNDYLVHLELKLD